MANRRKFLAGIGALASGSAAAVGTGAFSSVSAARTVNIDTVGDSSAYLRMDPTINTPNAEFASDESDSTVEVTLDSVNRNAETVFSSLFRVENQGTQPVVVYVSPDPGEGVSPTSVTPGLSSSDDRGFPSIGSGTDDIYIDPQASNAPNAEGGYSLTGVYGSTIPESIAEYEGLGDIGDRDGTESPDSGLLGADLTDRVIGVGESFDFGLNIQHAGNATFPDDISVSIKAVDQDEFI